jgi:hypothetical protein
MIRVALFGAPGTGKTQLARELGEQLAQLLPSTQSSIVEGNAGLATDCDIALLLGLDLPSAAGQESEDAVVRERLHSAGVSYQVVYGQGLQRLRCALRALAAAGVLPRGAVQRQEEGGAVAWSWVCDKCSDPACEHRLFTRLRQER